MRRFAYCIAISLFFLLVSRGAYGLLTFKPYKTNARLAIKHPFSKGLNLSPSSARCQEYISKYTSTSSPRINALNKIVGYINNFIFGTLFLLILRVFNTLRVHRLSALLDLVLKRPKGVGLLTVSNHQSMADDPGIWSAILPFWIMSPEQLRWSLCTHDVFFYRPWLTSIMSTGNAMPLDRKGSLDQPLLKLFLHKLVQGSWCHIFPEGRVWQNWRFDAEKECVLGPFKWGVGKLVAHAFPNVPIVLPMYHRGMSDIIPEKQLDDKNGAPSVPVTIIPQTGKDIQVFIGTPLDFTAKLMQFNEKHPGQLSQWRTTLQTVRLYGEITEEIRRAMVALEAVAYARESKSNV